MLEKRKNVRKIREAIIVLIMAIMVILSVYIKARQTPVRGVKEIETVASGRIEHVKSSATITSVDPGNGTIKPTYKPEWTKISSSLDLTNKALTIKVKGTAYLQETINDEVSINYASDVVSSLSKEDITVYVDGVEVTSITNPEVTVDAGATSTNATSGKVEVTHDIKLSKLEEAVRQSGALYKNWSGNISIKIGGRGEDPSTYNENVLIDNYGNQNMAETDEDGTNADGTWIDVKIGDTETDRNTDGTMFADFIKPEFTYVYSNSDIDYANKNVTVVFDAVDKYFTSSTLAVTDLTIKVDNQEITWATEEEAATAGNTKPVREFTNVADATDANGNVIGKRYTLVLSNLEQVNAEGFGDGFTYSGVVTIGIPEGKITDKSNNTNNATTLTIGIDEPELELPSTETTIPYLPVGYHYVEGDLDTGLVIADSLGNEFVWVEVPRTEGDDGVYKTAGLSLTTFDDADYEKIENDLHTYTSAYREENCTDTYLAGNGLTSDEYTALKKKTLKSIYTYGGFYVGRYETGIADSEPDVIDTTVEARKNFGDATQTPVIQKNAYPYNFVTNAQSQTLASSFATNLPGYESSLMFGVQWDLMLKHIETKEVEQGEDLATIQSLLNTDSTSWGNYLDSTYNITNTSAKYSTDEGKTWTDGTYEKTASEEVLLSTGASEIFSKQKIYDFAGNVEEWVLEQYGGRYAVTRGAGFNYAINTRASLHGQNNPGNKSCVLGFRVSLIKDVDESANGQIVDVVDPIWELDEAASNLGAGKIVVKAQDKYFDANRTKLEPGDITVYVNGTLSTSIEKAITGPTKIENGVQYEIQLEKLTIDNAGLVGFKPTNQEADNLIVDIGGTATSRAEASEDGFAYYRAENGGNISIEIAEDTAIDTSGNGNKATPMELGYVDTTKPEVHEIQKTQNAGGNTETIVFNVTDRNYDPSDLVTLTVDKNGDGIVDPEIKLWMDNVQVDALISASTLTSKPIKADIDGTNKILGHQYTLTIQNIAETELQTDPAKKYLEWSGTLKIEVEAGASKDFAGNTLNTNTTTITDFVDYIKPQVKEVPIAEPINKTDKTYTMSFTVIDKYLNTNDMVEPEEITVYVDGEPVTAIEKPATAELQEANKDKLWMELTNTEIEETFNKTENGVAGGEVKSGTYVIGHTYTLVLSNFEQSTKQTENSKDYYEWSGTVKLLINQDAVQDTSSNTLDASMAARTIEGDHVDFIKPKVEYVSSTSNASTKTETIVFNIMDKYLDITDPLTIPTTDEPTLPDEIEVYVDGELVTGLTRTLTKIQDFKTTINGTPDCVVGQQYQLEIKGFEQASRNAKDYKDWSGTVSIVIAETAMKDTSLNNLETPVAERTLVGDFVDYIKPDLEYTHHTSDISIADKKYTMTFDVTDKYYDEGELALSDLIITMNNGQYERDPATGEYKLDENNNKIPIIYNLKNEPVTIGFSAVPKYATDVKVTNAETGAVETKESHQIGHTYTVTISGLEQLEIKAGLTTSDYSGIINVVAAKEKISDRADNKNVETTITTGVNIEGGSQSGTEAIVDVVDPRWDKVSSYTNAREHITEEVEDPENPGETIIRRTGETRSIATVTFKGTDTYWNTSTLTTENLNNAIKVLVNGTEVTSGITVTLDSSTNLIEDRLVNGVNTPNVQYGIEYKVTVTGFNPNANQVKLRIPKGILVDRFGNDSELTDIILYNVLKEETNFAGLTFNNGLTQPFLGESVETTVYPEGQESITHIPRGSIEQIVFENSISGSEAEGVQRVWDVSAQGDKSILAWTSQTNEPYTVYIGSDDEIFANQNSRWLFAFVASKDGTVTKTKALENIELLNTTAVLSMSRLFYCFGRSTMTELDLGDKFYTSNVTNMENMFGFCGYNNLENLELGDNFDTSNVQYMQSMFISLSGGSGNSIELDLKSKFDTSKVTLMDTMFHSAYGLTNIKFGDLFDTSSVTTMKDMFYNCRSLTSLNLGGKFDTSSVTNMSGMFGGCSSLTELQLGQLFNTSAVTDMSGMFQNTGASSMTSLDLGDKFYTTSVTDMSNMFKGTGSTAMTSLDLGPVFTKIADANTDFATNLGKPGELKIYAPESIYSSQNAFKLSSTETETTITLDEITDDPNTTDVVESGYRGTIIPQYKPVWQKVSSTIDEGGKTLTITVKGSAYQTEQVQVEVETENEDGTITTTTETQTRARYASDVTSALGPEDITVFVDGVEVTSTTNPYVEVDGGTSIVNETTTLTERQHVIVLSNLEEAIRQSGVPYKEWSGNIAIQIGGRGKDPSTYTQNVLVDDYGNQNMAESDEGQAVGTWIDVKIADTAIDTNTDGTMFADFIKPEFTYIYSEADTIDYDNKTVTVVFDAVDKYFASSSLAVTDLTIKVDNETITWATAEEAALPGNTKPVREFTSVIDVTDPVSGAVIGKQYTLVLKNLEQVDSLGLGDGFTYSGIVTIGIPAEKIVDKSGNKNSATTLTIGVEEPGPAEYLSPSALFDADGTNTDGLHIGDFVNYDAGTWTQEEIDAIQVGPKDALVTASGSTNLLSSKLYQFGGFAAGSSRNGNATPYDAADNKYIKEASTGNAITGWRVFDINDDGTVTLISAGNPEDYCHYYDQTTTFGYVSEYILTGNVNTNWTDADTSAYQKRDWSNYINAAQDAENVKVLTKTILDNWFSKYIIADADTYTSETFKMIYEEPYIKYQNLIENNSNYWLSESVGTSLRCVYSSGSVGQTYVPSYGLRILVTLSPDVLFSSTKTGTKTLSGGNMDTYGGNQTYNTWAIKTDPAIVDVVDPAWEVVREKTALSEGKVTLRVKDKYFESSELAKEDVTVYTNGVASTTITKTVTGPTYVKLDNAGNYVTTENVEEAIGAEYVLNLGNIVPEGGGYVEFTPTNADQLVGDTAKYRNENGGHVELEIAENTATDESGNTNKTTPLDVGHMDETSPEVYDIQKIKDANADTVTYIFNVTDKNYDSSDPITLDVDKTGDGVADPEITAWVDGVQVQDLIADASALTSVEIKATIDGTVKTVGHQYTLVLSDIVEAYEEFLNSGKEYQELSGTIEIRIDPTASKDIKQNTINPATTTINEFVDFIKPAVTYRYSESSQGNPGDIDYEGKTFKMEIDILDKYINESTLKTELDNATTAIANATTAEERATAKAAKQAIIERVLTVLIDNEAPDWSKVNKDLTIEPIEAATAFNKTVDGEIVNDTHVIGYRYTLVLSNLEQLQIADGDEYLDYSGIVTAAIAAGIESDSQGNSNVATTITSGVNLIGGGTVALPSTDYTKPYLPAGYHYVEGNLSTGLVIADSLGNEYVWVEVPKSSDVYSDLNITEFTEEELTNIERELNSYTETYDTPNNSYGNGDFIRENETFAGLTSSEYFELKQKMLKSVYTYGGFYVGRYETGIDYNDGYRTSYDDDIAEYAPVIKQNAYPYNYVGIIDAQTLASGFAENQTGYESSLMFGVQWDLIMKYLETKAVEQGIQLETIKAELISNSYGWGNYQGSEWTINNKNAKYYDSGWIDIEESLSKDAEEILLLTTGASDQFSKQNIFDLAGNLQELILENLNANTISGSAYAAKVGGKYVRTSREGYVETSSDRFHLSSGGSTYNENGFRVALIKDPDIKEEQIVDVVDPLLEKVSASAEAIHKETVTDPDTGEETTTTTSTATITFKGTDKYFNESILTQDNVKDYIKVYANTGSTPGSTASTDITDSVEMTISAATAINSRTDATKQIGDEYTLTITGFAENVNQVKIKILEGAMTDQSGNSNKETEMIIYNVLRLTNTEGTIYTADDEVDTASSAAQPFLGNTTIERQNIENVTFLSSTETAPETGWWDVSAAGDNSIIAWATQTEEQATNGTYTVYIASDSEIFANQNSSYLFSYVGYGENCTAVEAVTGLNLLNEAYVTDMSYMFNNFGNKAMTTLELGTFITDNVTNMSNMFNGCGQTAMTTFSLGSNFNTAKVQNMSGMFQNFGQKLESLTLGDTFYTSEVTDMSNMFNACGQTSMKTINLGNNFDTSKVENMSGMFKNFAHNLQTLDLGDNFDTSKVEDMSEMFQDFAKSSTTMTSLDLGEKFYTTAATNMSNMFNGTGATEMTSLDLGPAFTKIADTNTDFVTNCGKANECVINAPESIYSDMKHFKLSTNSTTTIEYSNGTINAKYKPEWSKVSSSLTIDESNIANSTMTIVISGKVDATVYENALQTVTSTFAEGIDASNLINVYVDGELTDADDITKTIEVVSTTETEVQYKIILSNFQEAIRQNNKNFLEWAGNVAVQFAKGTLQDAYGNSNMVQIDLDPNDLSVKTPIVLKDSTALDANVEEGKMFADYIKPEFTYEFINTEIGSGPEGNKKVKVVFDVTDKYFNSTDLESDSNAELITVLVDGELPGDTNGDGTIGTGETLAITKTLTKTSIFVMNKDTKAITTQNTDYEIQANEQKVGERYELVIDKLQQDPNDSSHFSGIVTLGFPAGIVDDKSQNENNATTLTIGVDEKDGTANATAPEGGATVDVVDPIWTGPLDVNTIVRTDEDSDGTDDDEVNITIIGSDKFYASNTLTEGKIKVYVDETEQTTISKKLTQITDAEQLATLAENAGLPDDVQLIGYILTLSNFGDTAETGLDGVTKIVIEKGTIVDSSTNESQETIIFVGNDIWEEANEPLESGQDGYPRYPAFKNDIVDFIDPLINYTYSTVKADTDGDGDIDDDDGDVSANPDIDYETKEVTVKFTVTDNYLLASDLMETVTAEDGSTIQVPKNMKILIDETVVYGQGAVEGSQVTATISLDNVDHTDGVAEYTLVVTNLQQHQAQAPDGTTPENGDGINFSGPMTVAFESGIVEDTSGNKNDPTSITLKTHVDNNKVDVVDPIIKYNAETAKDSITINKDNSTVELRIRAEDKYLSTAETLSTAEGTVKVKVVDENGNTLVNDATTITKDITKGSMLSGEDSRYTTYTIELSEFGIYEGIVSVIIPADVVKDSSGNGNVETELLVGLVDFTKPTWYYSTSSINRNVDENGVRNETGTVTLEVKGTDIYFDNKYYEDETYELDTDAIIVSIDGTPNDAISVVTKSKDYIEEENDYGRILKGVKYTLELSGFGINEGAVTISIPKDAIKDTSGNGNILTPIDVGNPEWVETVGLIGALGEAETEDTENPKYTAFRNDIVDFIKPVIKYQYVAGAEGANPELNRANEEVYIKFTTTDTNFLESKLGTEDLKIYIDNMQVFGDGADSETMISATLSNPPTAIDGGFEYTLTLSALELNKLLASEIFERHSGVIRIEIAANQIADSSGNKNDATTIIVDNGDGDDASNGIIVDFVNPNIYYHSKYINWEERYALVTLRATDRFFDTNTELKPSDITLYEQNDDGDYIQITDLTQSDIEIGKVANDYGIDYVIKIKNFEEEYNMKIVVKAGAKDETTGEVLNGIADTSGNLNDATDIFVTLDNRKPTWKYVSADTSKFEDEGKVTFTVKGYDKYLNLGVDDEGNLVSSLEDGDLKLIKDGVDITDSVTFEISDPVDDEAEVSRTYQIDITGLPNGTTETGTYSLVFAKDTIFDIYSNGNSATTITFFNSAIDSNTGNYRNVTYHVTPDMENVHSSYVHELMSVITTGTNSTSNTFRPSTLGELFNNGENPLFAEPIEVPAVDGYTVSKVYAPKAFAGWAECDADGNIIEGGEVYGIYDEIEIPEDPTEEIHLKAVWQDAKVVFVSTSAENADDANDGTLSNPVKTLERAYELITPAASGGTAENNIIVIMDAVEFDSNDALSGNATITSLYGGTDYSAGADGAELKVSSDMIIDGDIIFDNIKLYVSSTDNKLISNYSGDITLGRGITTPSDKYTFGAVIGGNSGEEVATGTVDTHTVRVEAGKYNNIIAGSALTSLATSNKSVTHNLVIGNMRDAAVSRNDKLTITGYVAIGENEQINTSTNYANVTLYSGTITASGDKAIYLRSIGGKTDGKVTFEMFGGSVQGDIYGGSRTASAYDSEIFNTLKFYGGNVTGNIFGQGLNDTFTGSSDITLQGNFSITGNVYGGSNVTSTTSTSVGSGNSKITVDSVSTTINGNIYGGSKATEGSTGFATGNSTITINKGTAITVYGSGENCGNVGTTNITLGSGAVVNDIFGGAKNNQVTATATITVKAGTVNGNIYGGSDNTQEILTAEPDNVNNQNTQIVIGDLTTTEKPTVKGVIYGGGRYDKVDIATIELYENEVKTSVFGGTNTNGTVGTANIYLKGMTVNEIYGGSQATGSEAGTGVISKIYLESGTVSTVYGGGSGTTLTQSNITLEGTAIVEEAIFGGSNTSGKVGTANVTLKSGTVSTVFGGGNGAEVGTANVTLDGASMVVDTIYGGSKDAGVGTKSNVTLKAGTVTDVFGGGLGVGVTTTSIKQQGATVTNIYGGSEGGDTETTNIDILNANVVNVYGGNKDSGTSRYTNINVHGTSRITGKLFGGGYKSAIGKDGETGTTTINIAGGTIDGDINGGSEQGVVYGTTNINVGYDAIEGGSSSLTPGAINIIGIIYGAGSAENAGDVTVYGDTQITMDNGTSSPITYLTADGKEKSIFGSGKGGAVYSSTASTDRSTISLKDFGTAENIYLFKSIEDTGNLYIGNSVIELTGALDVQTNATQVGHYYTLNTITNSLTIYGNTTIYTQRGFNKVGGFYSYVNKYTTPATASISGGVATTNVDNRLYTLEGINLIFAKKEVNLKNKASLERDDWGKVNGMTYFGVYKNTSTGKQYDLDLFRAGTYVEGQYNSSTHNINTDGFYTTANTEGQVQQVIETVNYTNYCDWIINAPTINYDVDLVASTYGEHSTAELKLDYKYASDYAYAAETIYTLNQVSANALKPGIQLIDPSIPNSIPLISENANNTFGLTMETADSGWLEKALTTILSADNGSFDGDKDYLSDAQTTAGSIKFKLHNSINITEDRDLGNVNIILTGQQPIGEGGTDAYTFKVAIAVSLQSVSDELKEQYTPSFTDRTETELNYTSDSRVDLSYLLYNVGDSPYAEDGSDYRVISTSVKLPKGTRITMRDYGQGADAKVYYYHVTGNEALTDGTRYLYRLSDFVEIGTTDVAYEDSNSYYHSDDGYVLEKYDISIDYIDSGIGEALAQETYLELRHSPSGTVELNNGDKTIKYNLVTGSGAVATIDAEPEEDSYSIVSTLDIPVTINKASLLEQAGVLDTKYYDQITGIAVQIVDEGNSRLKSPDLQNFKLINASDSNEVYEADVNGVIRMPIMDGLGTMTGDYILSLTQASVDPGTYKVEFLLITADDGKYYGTTTLAKDSFNITFISALSGNVGVNADYSTRIISQSTGKNLVDGSDTSKAIDMTLNVDSPTAETNIRVELYKRQPTYTNLDAADGPTYTGTLYELVDIKDYIQGTWTTPEESGLISATGSKEYMIKSYESAATIDTIEFEKAIVSGISTGEYKLVFKAYSGNTFVQETRKTFIVVP